MANKDAYEKAANAVKEGVATPEQTRLNNKMAKQMGNMGNKAREARK